MNQQNRPEKASGAMLTQRRSLRALVRGGLALAAATVALMPAQAPAHAGGKEAAPAALSSGAASSATAGVRPVASIAYFTPELYERRLNLWANRARDRYGARPLAVRTCHDGFAEQWARHLVSTDSFYHQDLGPYMSTCRLTKAGEILAAGPVKPYHMIQMWLNSPGHRALLLDPSYGDAGISARRQDDGSWLGCIDFGRS